MLWLLGSWYVFGFALIYWFGYQLFFKGPKKGSLEESWNQIDPQHRQRTQRRKLACFFAMLGSFGFLFLAVASMIYNSYNPNRFTWDALDGQVVTVARLPSGELKNCYVRYVYGGVTYRQMVRKDLDRELERDSLIPLLVDPNNPRHVEVRRNFFFYRA